VYQNGVGIHELSGVETAVKKNTQRIRTGDESHRLSGVRTGGEDKSLSGIRTGDESHRLSGVRTGDEDKSLSGIRTGDES
jgi:hypothetical protein